MFTPDGVDLCVKTCLYKKSPVILKLRGVIDRFLYFMEKNTAQLSGIQLKCVRLKVDRDKINQTTPVVLKRQIIFRTRDSSCAIMATEKSFFLYCKCVKNPKEDSNINSASSVLNNCLCQTGCFGPNLFVCFVLL